VIEADVGADLDRAEPLARARAGDEHEHVHIRVFVCFAS
jgi:hypothetical protein